MISTDRRSVMKFGMLAGAGLAAPQVMVRAARAQVPQSDVGNAGFNRFKLGGFEITAINDGARAMDAPHTIFGENQPQEDVAALLERNFLPADRLVNSFTPVLVNTGSELVLFDTGLGAAAREGGMGQLLPRLEASGYSADDVSIVVVTHFHGDHIGGLMEGDAPAFPNARYVMGQEEYDFWTADERLSGPTQGNAEAVRATLVPLAENATFVGDDDDVVSGITAMAAAGHTPGHMVYHLESEGNRLMLTADTANHYVLSLQQPEWHVRFDMDKDAAGQTRRRVFDLIASERIPFIGYHMPFPAAGFAEPLDGGFRFVPTSYQFLL